MKRSEPIRVDNLIRLFLREEGTENQFDAHRICYLWSEIMGPGITRFTGRRWVDGTVLHVHITSASLKHDLSFMADSLVSRLNAAAGRSVITRIIFH